MKKFFPLFCVFFLQASTASALSLLGILQAYSDAQSGMSGEAICKKYHIKNCSYSTSQAEAICKAGGDSHNCRYSMSLPEAVCHAGGGGGNGFISNCRSGMSLPEALCYAGGGGGNGFISNCRSGMSLEDALKEYHDHEWDWDSFYNQGQHVWACRGVQTGQFAEYEHCSDKIQTDDRWPGPDLLP